MRQRWYNIGGRVMRLVDGGAAAPGVATGLPQGGYAAPQITAYNAGPQTLNYGPLAGNVGQGVQGSTVATNLNSVYNTPTTTSTTTTNTGGGGSSSSYVAPVNTNTNNNNTYGGHTYDDSQNVGVHTGGTAYDDTTNIGDVTYSPEELAAITTDLSQSSLVDTDTRIADNTAYVNDIVAGGNGNISAGPNTLDASQVGANLNPDTGADQYHKNFQENFAAQSAHAQSNPTGQSTGVPIYEQGFDFSDAGISALLPPTASSSSNNDGNIHNDVGNAGWGFTSFADMFDGGGPGASGDTFSGGIHGDKTVGDATDGFQFGDLFSGGGADPWGASGGTAVGAATADRGSRSVRDQRQAELRADAGLSESAEDVAGWRGLSYAEKEAAIATNKANIAKANEMFSSSDNEQHAYNQQVATNEAQATAAGLDNLSGSEAKAKLNELGLGNFAKEDAADTLQSKINSGEIFQAISGSAQEQLAAGVPAEEVKKNLSGGYNMGGPISLNYGGQVSEEQRRQGNKIAQSKAVATPLKAAAPLSPGQVQKGGGMLGQAGMAIGKKALGAALTPMLGPLGPLLGGLFNEGGQVMGYNNGGKLNQWGRPINKQARTKTTGQSAQTPAWWNPAAWFGSNPNRAHMQANQKKPGQQSIWEKLGRNDGGPIGLNDGGNPHGYNEGGPGVGPTPIKRVQDEQKVELDRMTWDKMEARKDWQAEKDEGRKEIAFQEEQVRKDEAHREAMKMKKAQATTNKAPLAGK